MLFPRAAITFHRLRLRDYAQEIRELGLRGTAFRISWELRRRLRLDRSKPEAFRLSALPPDFQQRLPFSDPASVAAAIDLPSESRERLLEIATAATRGRIFAFSRDFADYGQPVDWYRNPWNSQRWNAALGWQDALRDEASIGDVKLTWEIGRFPQAYHLSRAAAFFPERRDEFAGALAGQMESFIAAAPYGRAIHWHSGQEIAFRIFAWLFAARTLFRADDPIVLEIANQLVLAAGFVERHIDYARYAVYNNHLLSEALLLFAAGAIVPEAPNAARWEAAGAALLEEGCRRQVYGDGGYIQQSHNYHRVAVDVLSLAQAFARSTGRPENATIKAAIARSVEFLFQHQNPGDGRLPNYGANDGALPLILSTCDYSDFRPALQSASVISSASRRYDAGPWDEQAAWLAGPAALSAPLAKVRRQSTSFAVSGHQVLRGRDEGSFATFRCGTLRDRFSQIDMLHADIWWRGMNVAVDGGSYLYNGPQEWHNHFFRTASHNTITIDGEDQMIHHRRFKTLYWTEAKLLQFEDAERYAVVAGEHYGYRRLAGHPLHRRSVAMLKDDLFIVFDHVEGHGAHDIRLHWLLGPFAANVDQKGAVVLATPKGPFAITILDGEGKLQPLDLARGSEEPRRGWVSRYYAEVVSAPSLTVEGTRNLPYSAVSILSGCPYEMIKSSEGFQIITAESRAGVSIANGRLHLIA